MAAAMVETMELLKIAGIEPVATGPIPPRLLPHAIGAPDFIFRNFLLRVQKIDPHARSSMSDDLADGRETEVDYLNGEVVKLARSLGKEAPVNRSEEHTTELQSLMRTSYAAFCLKKKKNRK